LCSGDKRFQKVFNNKCTKWIIIIFFHLIKMMVIPTILYVLLAISFLDRIIAEEAAARATTTVNVEKFKEKLAAALNVTKNSVKEIANEWQISKYPKFLKSAFMHKSAWETMKWKFMKKILTQQVTGKQQAFVASFSGR
jgi:hypothetical protein